MLVASNMALLDLPVQDGFDLYPIGLQMIVDLQNNWLNICENPENPFAPRLPSVTIHLPAFTLWQTWFINAHAGDRLGTDGHFVYCQDAQRYRKTFLFGGVDIKTRQLCEIVADMLIVQCQFLAALSA